MLSNGIGGKIDGKKLSQDGFFFLFIYPELIPICNK